MASRACRLPMIPGTETYIVNDRKLAKHTNRQTDTNMP